MGDPDFDNGCGDRFDAADGDDAEDSSSGNVSDGQRTSFAIIPNETIRQAKSVVSEFYDFDL